MASGYYQLEVADEDRDKTAFCNKIWSVLFFVECHLGCVMLQQLSVVSISLVLRGLSWKSVIAFLDDVVVLGRDFDSHMVNLSDVLRRFEQYGMKLKPKKCQLLQGISGFLRAIVSRKGVQVPPGEITRIGNFGCTLVQARCSVFLLGS